MIPNILFVGVHDWAGICRRIATAINRLAEKPVARIITVKEHPFGYEPPDWAVDKGRLAGLEAFAAEADWIISTGDGITELFAESLDKLPLKAGVKVGVTHAGTAFRTDPQRYHDFDDAIGAKARFVGADSFSLMAGDPRAVPYFGPSEILASYPTPKNLRIAHSPTSREKKGTDLILPVLMGLQGAGYFEVDLIEGVPWEEAIERRHRAQIFVDQMVPGVGGWGMSAIEALSAGCAVLADLRNVTSEVYSFFAKPPIEDVRDAQELKEWLRLYWDRRDVLEKARMLSRAWAEGYAAPRAVARYFLGHLDRLGG